MSASKGPAQTPAGPDIVLNVDKVETLRELAGWNYAELARRAGMDQSAIMRLLAGEVRLGRRSMAGLKAAFRGHFGNDVHLCKLFTSVGPDGEVIPDCCALVEHLTAVPPDDEAVA